MPLSAANSGKLENTSVVSAPCGYCKYKTKLYSHIYVYNHKQLKWQTIAHFRDVAIDFLKSLCNYN